MSSIFKNLRKRKKSTDGISLGSNSSLFNSVNTSLSPYTVNEKILSPFLKAVWKNDLSKVKKLMKKSYNEIDQERRTGFHLACASGNLDIIKELLSNYANEILEKRDINEKTGLFKAVEKGISENVQYLVEKGAKTDVKDDKKESLIHAAIRHKHLIVLQYLLHKEVNCVESNKDEDTPLHLATELNFVDGLRLLLTYPTDINAKNNTGKTPLIIASESGYESAVKMLLSNDADPIIVDNEGYNAWYYASFHQRTECMKLLNGTEELPTQTSYKKQPVTLGAPEFLATMNSVKQQESIDSTDDHGYTVIKAKNPKSEVHVRDGKRKKSISQESINSNSSWIEEFASTSSDTTIPKSHRSNEMPDISTPSSMPNPSEILISQTKGTLNKPETASVKKQISEDEESQWTDNDKSHTDLQHPVSIKEKSEKKVEIEITKVSDSEWDSDDTEHQNVQIELSTIDEESTGKRSHIKSLRSPKSVHNKRKTDQDSSDLSVLGHLNTGDDGQQTDSNIEECYNANYIITNPPIRYDSLDALNNSIDDDSECNVLNELSITQIPNTNYNKTSPIPSRPPKSPSVLVMDKNIPTITVGEIKPKKRTKHINQAGGDNLSYSSTEVDNNSRHGSLAESDSLNVSEYRKSNLKALDEYMKKCTQLESKLRSLQSEKDCLQLNINSMKELKDKSESERLKLNKENQNLETTLSEKMDELYELKSKFVDAEEQLKKREKELFEIRKAKQGIEDKHNQLEINNIAANSKIKQLQQELENLHLDSQKSQNSQTDSQHQREKHEEELNEWIKTNEELKRKNADLSEQINQKDIEFVKTINEQRLTAENLQKQYDILKQKLLKESDDKESLQEEIDQLRKTIKNLNCDLESSNKSIAIATKQERENNELKEQIQQLEKNYSNLLMDKENLTKSASEKDTKLHKVELEIERLENQVKLKNDRISHLEMQYKTYENQSKDLEKLLERKNFELKEYENKLINNEAEMKKEIKKNANTLDIVNEAINTAINDCPDSPEILEKLQNIRQSINNCDYTDFAPIPQTKSPNHDSDLSIELAKSKSQIRMLQDQIDQMKRNLKNETNNQMDSQSNYSYLNKSQFNGDEIQSDYRQINSSKSLLQFKQISDLLMMEVERIDKLEQVEKQMSSDLRNKTRVIQSSQQDLTQLDRENMTLKEHLKEEKQKYQLMQEKDKSLSIQLRNEIKRRKQLSEALDSVKYWLDKYAKQMNLVPHIDKDKMLSQPDNTADNVFSSLPTECSAILQSLSESVDDLKIKLRKSEMKNTELHDRKSSLDKSQEILNENSQTLLNKQLIELTQMMETQRANREKLEKIRDENEFQLRNELYQLKQQNMMDISQLNNKAGMIEEDRDKLAQENRVLNEMLVKERQLKDSLTEQLVNLVKSSQGSNQQLFGFESTFPSTNGFVHPSQSQFSMPMTIAENDRKCFSNSMLNLSVAKSMGVEDEELRQRLRQELDRSIAKHLESGKPIRQLNIKEKIRSLQIGRYPNTSVSWKSP